MLGSVLWCLQSPGAEDIWVSGLWRVGGCVFSVRHVCIPVCSCHRAAYVNTGVTLPVEPERMCVRVCLYSVCV